MEISYATSSNLDIAEGDVVNGVARQVRVMPVEHLTMSSPGLPPASLVAQWRARIRDMSAMDWMEMLLPCTRWVRTYQWSEYLQVDLMAGITVGVMLVPQVRWPSGLLRFLRASGPLTAVILGTTFVKIYHPPISLFVSQCALAAIVISVGISLSQLYHTWTQVQFKLLRSCIKNINHVKYRFKDLNH